MLKLTPGANKANAILIRIVLFLIGGIAIITGMCLFSGDMWMLTPRAEQYQPATGDLVDVVIYEPSKFFFALLYVFIITLVWLLAVRKIPWRPIQHPILPLMVLIAAGIFIFLHPEVTPGRDASIQYGKHNTYYASIFWMKTRSGSHSAKQSKYETFVEAKDPAGLSTETILAEPGAVKWSGIASFTPCHSMKAGFRTSIRRSLPTSVVRLPIWIRSLKTSCLSLKPSGAVNEPAKNGFAADITPLAGAV